MAISRLSAQDAMGSSASFSVGVAYPGATTANNLLIAVVASEQATGHNSVSGGGTWTKLLDQTVYTGASVTLFYKLATGSETTITGSSASGSIALDIFEYTGNANPIQTDGTAAGNNNASSVTSQATPTITTANASDLIFTVLSVRQPGVASPSWSTATLIGSNLNGSIMSIWCGEKIVSSPQTSYSDTSNWTASTQPGSIIAAFQASGGGTPLPVNFIGAATRSPRWQ